MVPCQSKQRISISPNPTIRRSVNLTLAPIRSYSRQRRQFWTLDEILDLREEKIVESLVIGLYYVYNFLKGVRDVSDVLLLHNLMGWLIKDIIVILVG